MIFHAKNSVKEAWINRLYTKYSNEAVLNIVITS